MLVLEENQVESAETRGISEQVDLDDLAALYTEAEDDARPSARGPHGSGASVDERRSRKPGAPRRCRLRPARLAPPPARPFARPPRRPGARRPGRAASAVRRNFRRARRLRRRQRPPACGRGRIRLWRSLPAPGGAHGCRASWPRPGSAPRRGNLREGHGEHVVQHEATLSAGESVSRTTISAGPTEWASAVQSQIQNVVAVRWCSEMPAKWCFCLWKHSCLFVVVRVGWCTNWCSRAHLMLPFMF